MSSAFAKAFEFRLTKKGLGKAVPALGIAVGSTLNWATLEGIIDAAEMAYRRRFLLEKYPHLADEAPGASTDTAPDAPDDDQDTDAAISVLDQLAEAGGPDLR
ncbi:MULTISPECIES: EcsC family protein [unclassified Streptomyces]|uniref:EcsC family protein n=1 Tax=unclassified Streptomyces TaxID=2593676 RepID=UPI0021AF4170|nr:MULTISPECIES: EcsC family protein [unclassified Streptomyces]